MLSSLTTWEQSQRIVVLTFDDACISHYKVVAPILKRYGFGATFYVCEFPHTFGDSNKSMDWQQIKALSDMGFEIGNHTWHHRNIDSISNEQLERELSYIEKKCDSLHIPKPSSFAYPAYRTDPAKFPILKAHGLVTARGGGDSPWRVTRGNPLLVPSYTLKKSSQKIFYSALKQARDSVVIVFTIHGVPDIAHPWVDTSPHLFRKYMRYLHRHHFLLLSMRDIQTRWPALKTEG